MCESVTLESFTVVLLPVQLFLQLMHLLPGVLHVQHLQNQMIDVLHAGRGRLWSRVRRDLGCLCILRTRRRPKDFNLSFKDFNFMTEEWVLSLHFKGSIFSNAITSQR